MTGTETVDVVGVSLLIGWPIIKGLGENFPC